MRESWSLSADLGRAATTIACVLAALSAILLVVELYRRRGGGGPSTRGRIAVLVSGLCALASLLGAVLRPVQVQERSSSVGPRLLVVADASRSIDLPGDDGKTRRQAMAEALGAVRKRFTTGRMRVLSFGEGEARPIDDETAKTFAVPPLRASDLAAALEPLAASTDEQPQAIVVLSDGRLDRPGADHTDAQLRLALRQPGGGQLEVPIHTVAIAEDEPKDASVRAVRLSGAVVAHQPVPLEIEIGCSGGLSCGEIEVWARELHLDTPPVERAHGTARLEGDHAELDLEVTLDRAGKRILEVAIQAPDGDTIPENDRRFVTVDVARDRVRLLHVAGRPTYDVRALRLWLKSDASVDVVAFFILRTQSDNVNALQDELALIPFPVDELFTRHLPSFDAVVLQDFDAIPYGLSKHLPRLGRYVKEGGGLIMVGGPNAFVSGNYGRTALAEVLPIGLEGITREAAVDFASFVPRLTDAGRRAPVLAPLRSLLDSDWPPMPGTNVVGPAREGATVLLEHPILSTSSGAPMPVLALGEYGSGRSIALTVDGSHNLLFSAFAAGAAGRGHGAFWDALLGWLMRDPRFEPATVSLPKSCMAGEPTELELRAVFGGPGEKAHLGLQRMGTAEQVLEREIDLPEGDDPVRVDVGRLAAGGYTATVRLEREGRSAPSRYDFACETGGDEWADPRPDLERLAAIAKTTTGRAVKLDGIGELPQPEAAQIIAERRVRALLPAWGWALIAAALLGAHWLVRRRAGLA